MSDNEPLDYVLNNGERYIVTISNYSRQNDYIIYHASIFDTAFAATYPFYFRFKALKKLHEKLIHTEDCNSLPEFPKTKSFGWFHKTNDDPKLIKDRIRDLEFYLSKLLNNGLLQKLEEIQLLQKSIRKNKDKRSHSLSTKPSL